MKRFLALLLIFINSLVRAQSVIPLWETDAALAGPESVVFVPNTQTLLVSNVNGNPLDIDGNGFISQLSLDGKIIKLDWLDGLDAPKGLALNEGLLYVSDINQLVVIDVEQKKIIARYQAENAKFLNDVAIDTAGNVYVSDMLTNQIYRLADQQFELWLEDTALASPNGLLVENGQLIVGTWGVMTNGFETQVPGHLITIDIETKAITNLGDGSSAGNLDGVEPNGNGDYLATDWMAGRLLLIKPTGESETLYEFEQGSADHTVILNKNLVIIPLMLENKLAAFKLHD